jgi:hypothetical protein
MVFLLIIHPLKISLLPHLTAASTTYVLFAGLLSVFTFSVPEGSSVGSNSPANISTGAGEYSASA